MTRVSAMLLACLSVVLSACGDEDAASVPAAAQFAPVQTGRVMLRAAAEAGPDDLSNQFLSPGAAFEVQEFEVPQLLCVRTDSQDYLHIPEVTTSPGAPAVFYAVAPADAAQPVMMVFHGNGLEFIEALASLFVHADPRTAKALLDADPGMAGFLEIDNRGGAIRGLRGELGGSYTAEALERGWGIVVPGNCWGDGGRGTGEIINYYLRGPRYGHIMDLGVWQWYRDHFPHDRQREYSFGCSGGGQRTAQLLLHDPLAVAASAIDSPADYLPGFKSDPPGLFVLLSGIPGAGKVLDDFYIGHYGSIEAAGAQSLGTQLLSRGIETPIYFAYSDQDTFATADITAPLAQALPERTPSDRALVWNTGEPVHCQINTRDRSRQALDWIARWTRSDLR